MLTAEIQLEQAINMINQVDQSIKSMNKDTIFFLGRTGSGKNILTKSPCWK